MKSKNNWRIILAFSVIYIIWGSTYLAILFAIKNIPPVLMSGFRFTTAGILLYSWCWIKKEKQPNPSSFAKNAICGVLMLFGGTVAVAWSEQYLSSGIAAIIVTSVPFWFILLDKKQWSFYFSNKIIIAGLLLGFAGVILLVSLGKTSSVSQAAHGKQIAGALVIIAGGIAWAIGSLYSKYKPTGNSVLMNAAIQLLVAGVFSFAVSIVTGEERNFSFAKVGTSSFIALLYLIIFGSLITYLCYLWLLKMRPPAQVSSYVYVNPVVAIILGAIIAGEAITKWQVISLVIIISGVLLINLPKYKTTKIEQLSKAA